MTPLEAIEKVNKAWTEHGDIEACPDYDDALFEETFPAIWAAWQEYKSSKRTLSALIDYQRRKAQE